MSAPLFKCQVGSSSLLAPLQNVLQGKAQVSIVREESQLLRCAQPWGTLPQQLAQSKSNFLLAPFHT